jgi:glutathione S-transferase
LRKPAQVPYPNAYATHEQAKEKPEAFKFNCAQRAHANLLENMPQTMVSMLIAGLEYPRATAALGLAWTVARGLYALAYVTRNGQRYGLGGGVFWLAQGGLWILTCTTAMKMF